ncbi:TAXI family TRAP transporter solute-binding subunit [Parasphingorhabdus pacifica]
MRRKPAPVPAVAVVIFSLLAVVLGGCQQRFDGPKLSLTTGSSSAVYHQLGEVLAPAWASELGMTPPALMTSAGSGQNVNRLLTGQADLGFSAADAAASRMVRPGGERLCALARMHDDYLQVVVPREAPLHRLADLRGLRVSVGPTHSGVQFVADRVLAKAGLSATDLRREELPLDESAEALYRGDIDAFFWSGGVRTEDISKLAERMSIRLVDLSDILPAMRAEYEEYGTATIPASAYNLPAPVTTLLVPNFLLVTDRMPREVAEALTRGVFEAQPALAAANGAARSIGVRSGIETMPIPLHPGALDYYRSVSI